MMMEPLKRPRRGHSPVTGRHRVMTAVSNDTLNWVCDERVLFPGSVPDVIRLSDGVYLMYYCGWEKSKMSYDGIHWFYLVSTYKSPSGEEMPVA